MTGNIFELVIYKVRNVDEASAARRAVTSVLAGYAGFIGWRQLVSHDDPHTFVDVVEWETHELAKAAASALPAEPAAAGFMSQIEQVVVSGHFV